MILCLATSKIINPLVLTPQFKIHGGKKKIQTI